MPAYTPNNEKQATMKRRRDIAILLVLISNVSAFVPNFLYPRTFMMKSANSESMSSSSTNVFSNFATISRVEVKNQGHDTVKTEREELAGGKRNHPAKKSKPKPRKNSKKLKEFQWLNWVYNHWRSTKPGELTEETLKQMVPAISTWGRRKTDYAAKRSEELLDRIIDENLAGNSHAELTVNLFNAAMDAYAKVGNHVKVQKILRRMNNLSTNHDHLKHLKPDNFSMSILATAWAKSRSPEAALKAEAILNYMETQNLAPNTVTYNAVLHAVALGDQIDKAVRAEDLVKRMKNRYSEGEGCKPDIYSYQSLIQAWSKTLLPGSPQRAEKILHWLDSEADKGDKSLAPNAHCFTCKFDAGIFGF